jgi:two-component system response regulator YesN
VLRKLRASLIPSGAQRQDLEILRSRYERACPSCGSFLRPSAGGAHPPPGRSTTGRPGWDLDLSGSSWAAALTPSTCPRPSGSCSLLSVQQLWTRTWRGDLLRQGVPSTTNAIAIMASFPQADAPSIDLIEELDRPASWPRAI